VCQDKWLPSISSWGGIQIALKKVAEIKPRALCYMYLNDEKKKLVEKEQHL